MTSQRGNILFLILLAVVLFAALAYAVTSSMRGGGQDASKESMQAAAAEILNYATMIEQTVVRLKLVNNCKLPEISFENSRVSGYTNNTAPRADKSCNVFDVNGGGMAWKSGDVKWLDTSREGSTDYGSFTFPSNVVVNGLGVFVPSTAAESKTLIVGLKYLTKPLCDTINAQFGYTTNDTPIGVAVAGDGAKYRGTFVSPGFYNGGGNTNGKRTACINGAGGYTFYHVLDVQGF